MNDLGMACSSSEHQGGLVVVVEGRRGLLVVEGNKGLADLEMA